MKTCPTCKSELNVTEFAKSRSTNDGLNWQCKACHKARMKKLRSGYAEHVGQIPESRRCSTCREIKLAAEFNRSKLTHDGLCNTCKSCEKAYRLARAAKNKVRNTRLSKDEIRTETPVKVCSGCGDSLPSGNFGIDRRRHDGLKCLCKKCDSKAGLAWRKANINKVLFKGARLRAEERGIAFSITLEDVVVGSHCPVLGIKFEVLEGGRDNSPSLDRIDNRFGYVPGNVVVVSNRANRLKSDASVEELETLVRFYKTHSFKE